MRAWIFTSFLIIAYSSGATQWYVEEGAAGANNGTSWASAWNDPTNIAWASIVAGDTLNVGGGPAGGTNWYWTFSQFGKPYNSGTALNPITIKAATDVGHNGYIFLQGTLFIGANFVTVNGAKTSWLPVNVADVANVSTQSPFKTNINWEVQSTNSYAIQIYGCTGTKILSVGVSGSGNSTGGLGGATDGVTFIGQPASPINGAELGYCYIHDAWGFGVNGTFTNPTNYDWGQLNVHHCLIEKTHDNYTQMDGYTDLHDCVMRAWTLPGRGHPDSIQEMSSHCRIYNNIIQDMTGVNCYIGANNIGAGQGLIDNLLIANNMWLTTTQQSGGKIQMTGTGIGGSPTVTNITLTNIVIIGNLSHDPEGESFPYIAGASGVSGSISNMWMMNNVQVLYTNTSTSAGWFVKSPQDDNPGAGTFGLNYDPHEVHYDFNSVSGGVGLGNGIRLGGVQYTNMLDLALRGGFGYTHNSNNAPVFIGMTATVSNYDFQLGADTALKGNGTNLSALAAIFNCPAITNDILGRPRPSSGAWDIGPFQSDPTLIMWLTSQAWPVNTKMTQGTNILDDSGFANHAWEFNTNGNCPTITNGISLVGVFNAHANGLYFNSGQPSGGNGQFSYKGNYLAVSNLTGGLASGITNGTLAFWGFYDTNATTAQDAFIDAGYSLLETNSWRGPWRSSGKTSAITVFDNAGNDTIAGNFNDTASVGTTTNWHHYCFTWQVITNAMIFTTYTDGRFWSTTNYPTSKVPFLRVGSSHHWLGISCWHHEGTMQYDPPEDAPNCGFIDGDMSDIRIYSRALSASDITNLVAGASATFSTLAPVSDPAITVQPQNQTVAVGQTATFSVTATGTAPISYFWYKQGGLIQAGSSSSYTTSPTTCAYNGNTVFVTVSNSVSQVTSSTATLTVTGCTQTNYTSQIGTANIGSGTF